MPKCTWCGTETTTAGCPKWNCPSKGGVESGTVTIKPGIPEQKVREALDIAMAHFGDRRERALGLIKAQSDFLGLELPENFGEEVPLCAHCWKPAEGNYSIHRDGFGEGPEVPLCDACGGEETPTCEDIWHKTSKTVEPQTSIFVCGPQCREGEEHDFSEPFTTYHHAGGSSHGYLCTKCGMSNIDFSLWADE